jgi:hypothetical protein
MIPATHSAEKTRVMSSDDHNTRLNEDLLSGKDGHADTDLDADSMIAGF